MIDDPSLRIIVGDCRDVLKTLPDECVRCCVTSPPYWGLRDYGVSGQIGLEETPEIYVEQIVAVFREVRRLLREDGTLWLNLGDTYSTDTKWGGSSSNKNETEIGDAKRRVRWASGLKPKDLVGIPWHVAFALQADGWYLRSEITWCKKVPMPESVRDRPTSATEKIFLLTKSARYWYDSDAVRNPPSESFLNDSRWKTGSTPENEKNGYEKAGAQNPKRIHRIFDRKPRGHERDQPGINRWDDMPRDRQMVYGSNMRNFWVLGPEPFKGSHFATFPREIPKRCIMAGCPVGGTVLDPFAGSGTTGVVALELGRRAILIELNPEYIKLCNERCNTTLGLPLTSNEIPEEMAQL